ncbi:ATP-NAD kinase-like domain-containing protein [Boletus coccyginus]|nr:ATP-NAD kinase-like domain-containing protein [Boletus coccyginus]
MAARELVLGSSNGVVTTLAFTGASLTVRSGPTSAASRSFLFASCARHSHSEIPLHNFIAATVSGTTVNVSYLARTSGERLHMNHVRGNVAEKDVPLATEWCNSITQVAYQGENPSKVLKVLINPHGGPGKATQIFAQKVEPILRAAGCTLDVTLTTRSGHGIEIAQNMELKYDALVVVSGDGLIHEVLNGLAKHATPEKAFCIPVAPIPAGSGNGLSLNILGLRDGLDPCAAALNVLKGSRAVMSESSSGRPMKIDLFSFTQGNQKRISFMSQTVGLMSDLDVDTEHLRWMGDFRFIWGFLRGVVMCRPCNVELSIKVVEQDKSRMVDVLHARRRSAAKGVPPTLPASDITSDDDKRADGADSSENWVKYDKPILWMAAGKGPYASRSLMQFPVSHPDDGLVDISIQEMVSRKYLLDGMSGAEIGCGFWLSTNQYFKASAYRAKPLTATGALMVDGEVFPFEEFQIEVLHRLGTLLSPYPHYAPEFKVIDEKGTMRETI